VSDDVVTNHASARDGSTTTPIELRLLHCFELRGAERIALPAAAQRLVALLALQPRPVHRLHAAGLLWPDTSDARALASLRSALWRAGAITGGLIDADDHQLQLADGVAVDFRHVSERARAVIAGREPVAESDLALLDRAGELLPDWYQDWVLTERERFRQLRLHALEALSAQLVEEGRYAEAADAASAAISADPVRESAHRALIVVQLAEGNTGDAIRQYRLFRRILAERVGMAPSSAMERLMGSLRRRDGSHR
jgi:DNA-binding SARP family transcriptional activator